MEANTTTEEKHAPAQPAVTTEVNEAKPAKDPGQIAIGNKLAEHVLGKQKNRAPAWNQQHHQLILQMPQTKQQQQHLPHSWRWWFNCLCFGHLLPSWSHHVIFARKKWITETLGRLSRPSRQDSQKSPHSRDRLKFFDLIDKDARQEAC